MKRILLFTGLAFGVALALFFALRASPDAMAVVIGVVLGVAAGIPTTLLVVFVMTRQQGRSDKLHPQQTQPPVIVINSGDKAQSLSPSLPALPMPSANPNGGRKWTVIGDAETD